MTVTRMATVGVKGLMKLGMILCIVQGMLF